MSTEAARQAGRGEGLAAAVLAGAAAVAWICLLRIPPAASSATMPGMSGMASPESRASLAAIAAPALAMTTAMMIPVAAPVLIRRRSRSLAFAIGYLALWLAFGMALTWLMMAPGVPGIGANRRFAAAALGALGLFQLSPAKTWALGACARLAATPSIETAPASVGLGLGYGLRCLASGGALMLAAGLLGAMSPAWMAALALVMLAEKTRAGRAVARITGVALLAAAGLRLLV